jgi:hypothetical protein
MNLKFNFPSETPGALVDIQKGRAIISFTKEELSFVSNLSTLLAFSGVGNGVAAQAGPDTVETTGASA